MEGNQNHVSEINTWKTVQKGERKQAGVEESIITIDCRCTGRLRDKKV